MEIRNFNVWLPAVRKLLNNPDLSDNQNNLHSLAFDIRRFRKSLNHNLENIQKLLDVIRLLRDAKGSGRGVFEEQMMQELSCLMSNCVEVLKDAGVVGLKYCETPNELPDKLKVECKIIAVICKFAIESIEFSRPRDSLAGKRRSCSFDILGNASCLYEMPENIIELVLKILKSNRRATALGALLFMESYYKARKTSVPADVEELLIDFVGKTDSRSEAVGALNILVESGNISEFTALDYISEWKERNYV